MLIKAVIVVAAAMLLLFLGINAHADGTKMPRLAKEYIYESHFMGDHGGVDYICFGANSEKKTQKFCVS